MQNVTNGINNVGKSLENREFDFRFTYTELRILRGIFQNLHPNHRDSPEVVEFSTEGFDELNRYIEYLEATYR